MTLQQLKYVSMVEKCGSFSRAAQKLYVSQPSISNLVNALEEELTADIERLTKAWERIQTKAKKVGKKYIIPIVPLARKKCAEMLNGYIVTPEVNDIDTYIVNNSLEGKQGIMGCLALGAQALQ